MPCGGGGLLSGTRPDGDAHSSPGCRVIGVEPAAGDDATRSFQTKTLQTVDNPHTVADGARTPSLGTLTFPLVLELVSDMMTVDDPRAARDDVLPLGTAEAGRRTDRRAGAAAVLHGGADARGARVGVILSGGNVDFRHVAEWLRTDEAPRSHRRADRPRRADVVRPAKAGRSHRPAEAGRYVPSATLAGRTYCSLRIETTMTTRRRRDRGRRSPSSS